MNEATQEILIDSAYNCSMIYLVLYISFSLSGCLSLSLSVSPSGDSSEAQKCCQLKQLIWFAACLRLPQASSKRELDRERDRDRDRESRGKTEAHRVAQQYVYVCVCVCKCAILCSGSLFNLIDFLWRTI